MPEDQTHQNSAPHLEHPPCPLCGATMARKVLDAGDDWIPDGSSRRFRFSVVRCTQCGGNYTSPRFSERSKHLAFAGSYPFYDRAKRSIGPPTEAEMRAFEPRVSHVLRTHPASGSVLDIGMGDGAFLAAMRQRGWDVAGIDIEPSVVAFAQSHLGIRNCLIADVEKDPLPKGPYDVVTLWGMLQLAYRPQALLERIRTILTPGGFLAIGLSNFDSTGAKLFRSHWRGLGLPRHLVHYDPTSLRNLLERSGYRVMDMAFETPAWIVNGSLDAALPLPGPFGKLLRGFARTFLGWLGRSRRGDTLMVLARAEDPRHSRAECPGSMGSPRP